MKVISYIMYGIFMLVLIMAAALFVVPSIPHFSNFQVKIVKSGSMEPYMMTGGIVVIRNATSYVEGEVITFTGHSSEIPTTHRIIGTENVDGVTHFITKGDANEERDTETVTTDMILGKVFFTVPYVGFILDFARQPLGFFLLIGIPALLIVIDEVERIWREIQRLRSQKKVIHSSIEPLVIAPYGTECCVTPHRVRMIDINRPISIPAYSRETPTTAKKQSEEVKKQHGHHTRPHWLAGVVSTLSIVGVVCIGSMGSTVSYFNDSEQSKENILGANALDFEVSVNQDTFAFLDRVLTIGTDVLTTTVTPVSQSVPVKYDVSIKNIQGVTALCDAIEVHVDEPFIYDGPLTAITATGLTYTGSWLMDITVGTESGYVSGDTCTLDMVYSGWNASLASPFGGYDDEERVTLIFTAHASDGGVPSITPKVLFMDELSVPPDQSLDVLPPNEPTHESVLPQDENEAQSPVEDPQPLLEVV